MTAAMYLLLLLALVCANLPFVTQRWFGLKRLPEKHFGHHLPELLAGFAFVALLAYIGWRHRPAACTASIGSFMWRWCAFIWYSPFPASCCAIFGTAATANRPLPHAIRLPEKSLALTGFQVALNQATSFCFNSAFSS